MKHRKTLSYLIVILFPFLAVWTAALATAFAFNPIEVFRSDNFWGPTAFYYVIIVWIILYGLSLYWKEQEEG